MVARRSNIQSKKQNYRAITLRLQMLMQRLRPPNQLRTNLEREALGTEWKGLIRKRLYGPTTSFGVMLTDPITPILLPLKRRITKVPKR